MVHELEEVLGIEAARSGHATGEATAVLRGLSDDTAEFAPARMRHPKRALWLSVALLAVAAGVIAFLATRTEEGPGPAAIPRTPGLSEARLSSDAAHDYDPGGGDGESSGQVQFAIDGNRTTEWDTETYDGGFEGSNKSGVGLYVDAGSPVAARQLDLITSTPGFRAAVYASNSVPAELSGWDRVSRTTVVKQEQAFDLDTASQRFRNYLLWISQLPEGGRAVVKELSLKK
jgi:serine/threonine-protein kinase